MEAYRRGKNLLIEQTKNKIKAICLLYLICAGNVLYVNLKGVTVVNNSIRTKIR